MNEYAQIREYIRNMSDNKGVSIFIAEVTKVEDKFCSVKIGDFSLTKVKNFCNEEAGNLLIKPKIGSMVTVIDFGDFRDMQIIKVQEVDEIIINGGQLGGLVKITELVQKLNGIIDAFNSHIHASAGTPPTTVPGIIPIPTIVQSKIEDLNIKH